MNLRKVLLIRTDRLGDVILSTPVATALKKKWPDLHVTFLVRNYTAEITRHHPHVNESLELDGVEIGGDMRRLAQALRQRQFEAAVMLHPRLDLAWALWRSGMPLRIGTGYRWYSFLFNQRVFEHRKTAARHEAEYNLRLLQPLGIDATEIEFHFALSQAEREKIDEKLDRLGAGAKPAILHPGSGGSSRDWPPEYFAQLADRLWHALGVQVILTGAPAEENLIAVIQRQTKSQPLSLCSRLTIIELAVLCQRAAVFVSNSTGPLHLAVMVGTPVVAFYPPIRAARPERWGPYGRIADVLMSQQEECVHCRKSSVRVCECMRALSVERAFKKVQEKLTYRL